ncbi:hypothetical protein MRX96_050718 [Rhipicephalus microplus]
MATDSGDEVGPTRVPQRSAAPPPPAGGDSRLTTPSSPIAAVRASRLPMSEPSGRHVWPARFFDRNGMVGSPSTPPEYYAPRATTPRAPTNRIALAAALESTRDRQPLLMTDAHTVPLQDGTVSPVQYCMIGLLFAGLCAAVAWSVRPLGKRTTPLRAQDELLHHEKQSRMPGYHPPVVGIADGQNAPVGLCVDACAFLAKPRMIGRRCSRCRDHHSATRHCGGRLSGTL